MKIFILQRSLIALCLLAAVSTFAQNNSRRMPPNFPSEFVIPENGDSSPPPSADSGKKDSGGTWVPSEPLTASVASTNSDATKTNSSDLIQLSFQGANVDMVAQWLSQTSGKTVVKHPRVQCQLTIISSKKMPMREAINMVYRALALEGFSAIELGNSILIVPAGEEPKMSPEVVTGSLTNVPAGRQRLLKVFSLKNIQATDLKERIKTALSDKATVDVDERANQIIITDYTDNLRGASDLIDALDNTRSDDVAIRIIPLKHIAADQLSKEIDPLYQKIGGKSSGKGTITVSVDDRSNSLIVLSSLADFAAIKKLVDTLDTEDAQEKTAQTFILKNADAQDVAKQLRDLNQSQPATSSRHSFFYSPPSETPEKKISVVADRRRNAVIVQGPPTQMESIRKMIQELDEPVSDGSLAPQIYPLKYASATDIEDVLNELFLKKTQQRGYWDYSDDEPSGAAADHDVGRLYGKVRITSEPYANAIIITSNSKENLGVIEKVLRELDVPSPAGESTLRLGLKFAKADTIANSLNILFAKNGSPAIRAVAPGLNQNGAGQNAQPSAQNAPSQTGFDLTVDTKEDGYFPWLGGQPDASSRSGDGKTARPVSDLVGRVRCVADQRGNALMVSANVHFFPQILKLISDLDAPADKVTIEARIVQVSSDYLDKLGVRWSPDGTKVFTADDYDGSLLLSTKGNGQKGIGNNTTVNSALQTLVSLRSGMVSSTLSIDFMVQFLRKHTDATVLGEPSITIDDNELGKLFVGQQVPVPDSSLTSAQLGGQSTTIKYKDVGVVLEVTPHINSDGDVQLKIHTESSTVEAGVTVLGGAVFNTANFRTEVTAKTGQTLLLGGIIQKQSSDILRKTPVLGDVPVVGWGFKKKDKSTHEVELMVFLKPTVVHSAEDSRQLQSDQDRKAPLLKKWMDESEAKLPKK